VDKTAFTHVTVADESIDPLCLVLPQPYAVEIWEAAPQINEKSLDSPGQRQLQPFNILPTTLLPGPVVVLDFNGVNVENDSRTTGPDITLLSACTFLPETTGPQRDDLIPEGSQPGAISSET